MSADNKIVAPDVCVRTAGPADFESLHEVDGRVFGELAYPYFTLRQLFDAFPACWLVAANPTGVVGYSFGLPSTDNTYAWLFGLAVDPNHRNLGYGTRLTRGTLNLLGTRLYRTFGFSDAEYRKNYFGAGEDRLVMTRRVHGIPTPRPDLGQG